MPIKHISDDLRYRRLLKQMAERYGMTEEEYEAEFQRKLQEALTKKRDWSRKNG